MYISSVTMHAVTMSHAHSCYTIQALPCISPGKLAPQLRSEASARCYCKVLSLLLLLLLPLHIRILKNMPVY